MNHLQATQGYFTKPRLVQSEKVSPVKKVPNAPAGTRTY